MERFWKVDSFAEYQIKVPLDKFQKYFEEILVYANYFKFIITAYSYKRNTVYLYADFHEKNAKRAEKFKSNLKTCTFVSINNK